MRAFLLPLALTIVANVIYHFSQKSVPKTANPLIVLAGAYIIALAATVALLIAERSMPTAASIRTLNWSVIAMGLAIVGVEMGFLLAYRNGLKVSLGAAISNVTVALVLLPFGVLFAREQLTVANVVGIACCIVGLVLIVRP
ncbi:MAG TPA: hypothetical protein VKB93_01720 [Thermoanaerobaculia bacterium]|nr:hypothetical protein [Thermoanaerobaculia bacterium]